MYANKYRFSNGLTITRSDDSYWLHDEHNGDGFTMDDIDFLLLLGSVIVPVGPTTEDILNAAHDCKNFKGFANVIASDPEVAARFLQMLEELDTK